MLATNTLPKPLVQNNSSSGCSSFIVSKNGRGASSKSQELTPMDLGPCNRIFSVSIIMVSVCLHHAELLALVGRTCTVSSHILHSWADPEMMLLEPGGDEGVMEPILRVFRDLGKSSIPLIYKSLLYSRQKSRFGVVFKNHFSSLPELTFHTVLCHES